MNLRIAFAAAATLVLVSPLRTEAQTSADALDVTRTDDSAPVWWGLLTFEAALLGTALAVPPLLDDASEGTIIAASIPIAAATIGAPFLMGHLASDHGWHSEPASASFGFLNAGIAGYAIGCTLATGPLESPSHWDVSRFASCSGEPLPWVLGGVSGLATAAWFLLRGQSLHRVRANDGLETGILATVGLANAASFLTVAAVDLFVRIFQSLGNDRNVGGQHGLFGGRGQLAAAGIVSLAAMGAAIGTAELSF